MMARKLVTAILGFKPERKRTRSYFGSRTRAIKPRTLKSSLNSSGRHAHILQTGQRRSYRQQRL